MWLFTRHGFYSATMSPVKKGHMQIRARTRADIERLKRRFPDLLGQNRIIETNNADYRWRTVMTPSKFTVLMIHLAEDIDYGNFKNACHANGLDTGPHHAVWGIMMREQRKERDKEQSRWDGSVFPAFQGLGAEPEEEPEDLPANGECWNCGETVADGALCCDACHEEALRELSQEEDEWDGQCPDCRVDWVQFSDHSGLHCPDCGHTLQYFKTIAEQRLMATGKE